jgi:hypothetical protein
MGVGNKVMLAHGTRISVLTTNDVSSQLCLRQDGPAMPIATPLDLHEPAFYARDLETYSVGFKTEPQRLSRNPPSEQVLIPAPKHRASLIGIIEREKLSPAREPREIRH